MNKINKINVCCQKVLPLVYDESLSYYEVLCKVIQKLNELIKINNNIRDEVHSDYLAVLEGAKVATEAVASVTAMRDEVLTLKQATEQYAHDVTTVYNKTVEARDTAIAKADIAEQSATTATEKANIAQASATTATEKADIAVQSATTATQKANSATEKADIAVQSATEATEKAERATQSANTATEKADIAVESANTATEKANIASTSATTATRKAEIAVQSANTATAKAEIAVESANTATEKANIASTSATTATQKATEAQTNADKVLTAMSLVSGTINYYKGDNIEMTIYGGENDSMSVTITPTIRNNVLYIYGNVTQELTGQVTIHLPNIVTKAVNMTQVFDWAKTVLPNIDVNNLPYVTFGGGNGNTYTSGATQEKLISTVAGKSIGAPWYSLNMQLFSNTLTEITVPYQSGTTLKYSFTIIQPLVFTNEVTPEPTDYITKLNEETQAREQADTQLQNNINTEKTARENADAQLKEDLANKITKFYASNQGEIHITDSDNGKIQDMMIYGKSSQDGTPTPDNPIEIQSVVNPKLSVSNSDNTLTQEATLPYTLNAIHVTEGGNVTIDGQQYIADYVDIENKKLWKYVYYGLLGDLTYKAILTGDSKWYDSSLSNSFELKSVSYNGHKFKEKSDAGLCSKLKTYNFNSFYNKGIENGILNSMTYFVVNLSISLGIDTVDKFNEWTKGVYITKTFETPYSIDLTDEEVEAFKDLMTYYPTTNVIVTSDQLDGYTTFNYPISMKNGWNYVKQQLNDNRDYIYDMDLQSAEAYVNSEYAVTLTELEV